MHVYSFIFALKRETPAHLCSSASAGEGLSLVPPSGRVCTLGGTVLVTAARCGGGEVTAAVTHCVAAAAPQSWNIKTWSDDTSGGRAAGRPHGLK